MRLKLLAISAAAIIIGMPRSGALPLPYEESAPGIRQTVTFKEFYTALLNNYPKLKAENANVEIAVARRMYAAAGYLPQGRLYASMTTGDDPVYVFGSLLRQRAFTQDDFELSRLNDPASRTNYNFGIYGEIPLFNAFQTVLKVKSAKLKIESAEYTRSFQKMETLLVGADAYFHALSVNKLLSAVREIRASSEEDIKQAEDLKEKGVILGADYYAAKAMLGDIIRMENELSQEQNSIFMLLNILMGNDPLDPLALTDTLPETGPAQKPILEWYNTFRTSRPDILALEKEIKAQETEIRRESLSFLPKVSGFGDLQENSHDLGSAKSNFTVGLKATADIFDPYYHPRVKEAKEQLNRLKYDHNALLDSVKKDISFEYGRYESARANYSVMRNILSDQNEAVKSMLPLYREGRKSIADLIEIRRGYLMSSQAYYNLLTYGKTSLTRLLFLSGKLNEQELDGILYPSESEAK